MNTDIVWLVSGLMILLPLFGLVYVLREKHHAEEKARDCIKEIADIGIDLLIRTLGLELEPYKGFIQKEEGSEGG